MSHANKADKLLIKPTAGARPASPRTLGRFIRKTRVSRSDARRVTNGTDDTTLTTAPDGPTQRLSQTPDLFSSERTETQSPHERLLGRSRRAPKGRPKVSLPRAAAVRRRPRLRSRRR